MPKRNIIQRGWRAAAALGLALALSGSALAQELTARERQLLEAIERLEARVKALEEARDHQAVVKESINERVNALEGKIEDIPEASSLGLRAKWKDGLYMETADQKYKLQIGGRMQFDTAFFGEDEALKSVLGGQENGVEFRRMRIFLKGTIYDRSEFKAQLEFSSGEVVFRDVYMGLKDAPVVGNIRIGHFYEPFHLDELTSDNDSTFLERSLADAFVPGRKSGIMLFDSALDERMTWAAGVFRDTDGQGKGHGDGDFNYTARVTGLPWYKDDGRKLLHLGADYSRRDPGGNFRVRARPEAHLSSIRYVDTGVFTADTVHLANAEAALVLGPFSAQGEYLRAFVDTGSGGAGGLEFSGYYVQASYFLTGEHRPYSTSSGTFGRVRPKRPFRGEQKGPGAWELALRYSGLNLDDGPVRGGEERNITAGVNWYLNPQVRVTLNYVHADIDHDLYDGAVNVIQMRFQTTF